MNKEKISVWNFSVLSSPNDFFYGVLEVDGEAFQADFFSSAVVPFVCHKSALSSICACPFFCCCFPLCSPSVVYGSSQSDG